MALIRMRRGDPRWENDLGGSLVGPERNKKTKLLRAVGIQNSSKDVIVDFGGSGECAVRATRPVRAGLRTASTRRSHSSPNAGRKVILSFSLPEWRIDCGMPSSRIRLNQMRIQEYLVEPEARGKELGQT